MALTPKQIALLDSCLILRENNDYFIALDEEVETGEIKKYWFTSYADSQGDTEWGNGTVKTTGATKNGYSQVKVLTNPENLDFVGQKFYIISSAKTDGTIYELYTDAGTTSAGIYVSISDTKPSSS